MAGTPATSEAPRTRIRPTTRLEGNASRTESARNASPTSHALQSARGSLLLQVAGVVLAMAAQWLLARLLGVDGFGHYAYTMSLVAAAHVVSRLGFDVASWRYIAAYRATESWSLLRGFVRTSRVVTVFASLLLSGVGIVALLVIDDAIDRSLLATLIIGCSVLPFYGFSQLQASQLVALRRPVAGYAPGLLLRPVLLIGGTLVLAARSPSAVTAANALGVHLLALGGTCFVAELLWRTSLPRVVWTKRAEYAEAEWLLSARSLWGISCLGLIQEHLDVILVGVFRGTTEAGIYAMASRLGRLISLGLSAMSSATVPVASELLADGRRHELQKLLAGSARGLVLFTVPPTLILLFGGHWILGCLGSDFEAGYPALVVLTLGQLFNAGTGCVGQLLNVAGHQRAVLHRHAIASLGQATLLLMLIPWAGMLGAAIAVAVTMAAWNLVLVREAWRRLAIDPTVWAARSART